MGYACLAHWRHHWLGAFCIAFLLGPSLAACASRPAPLPPVMPPELVRDINGNRADVATAPTDFVVLDDTAYFLAGTANDRRTVWRSDGTAQGTYPLINNLAAATPNGVSSLTSAGTNLFYIAATGPAGAYQLWRSNTTTDGAAAIADLGYRAEAAAIQQIHLAAAGDTLYFISGDNSAGPTLYRSDGTAAGTVPLHFFEPLESEPVQIGSFTPVGNQIFFTATHTPKDENAIWRALWRSDGTKEGTRLLYEQEAWAFTPVGDRLYFSTESGRMVSDGTRDGTRPVEYLDSGKEFTTVGDQLYFTTAYGTLWTSDGTPTGTTKIPGFGADDQKVIAIAGAGTRLYIMTSSGADAQTVTLWTSDGTPAGAAKLHTFSAQQPDAMPYGFTAAGNTLYFFVAGQASNLVLWRSDGTEAGTRAVGETAPGKANAAPQNQDPILGDGSGEPWIGWFEAVPLGGQLLFSAGDGHGGLTLWVSDGTEAGTRIVLQGEPGSASSTPIEMRALGDRLLFFADDGAHGAELWASDGSEPGTTLLSDANPGAAGSPFDKLTTILFRREPAVIGDRLYFTATTGDDLHLWSSDGTAQGTTALQDADWEQALIAALARTRAGTTAFGMINAAGTVYYYHSAPDNGGLQLWRSDGTPAGATRVSEAIVASGTDLLWGTPAPPVALGELLLFMARDSEHGSELWASDGTAAGTRLVKDIEPGTVHSQPFALTVAGGKVFFIATTKANGRELWVSDGSTQGTKLVKDIKPAQPEPSDSSQRFVAPEGGPCRIDPLRPDSVLRSHGDLVYFMADDGEHGCELWRSDGTPAGTTMVADINPGKGDISQIRQGIFFVAPIVIGPENRLYFAADDGTHGAELWTSDGTAGGTTMVMDANPGARGGNPSNLYVVDNRLYFIADDGTHGVELWSTDGTPANTAMIADLNPGLASAYPYGMIRAGAKLFFGADDGRHGSELWSLPIGPEVNHS